MHNLTLIIPAYNEAENIQALGLVELSTWWRYHQDATILIVDDGSTDDTAALCKARGFPVLTIPHRGKAGAIAAGLAACRTEYAIVADFDMSTPLSYVEPFHALLVAGYEIVMGSRGLARPGAPWWRVGVSLGTLIARRMILGLPWVDTQCGFKGYQVSAARRILDMMRVYDYAALTTRANGPAVNPGFDFEMLYLADPKRVIEVPVEWRHRPTRRVRLVDIWRGLRELVAIRRAWGGWGEVARQTQ